MEATTYKWSVDPKLEGSIFVLPERSWATENIEDD